MPTVPGFVWMCVGLALTIIVIWLTDDNGGAAAINQHVSTVLTLAFALPWALIEVSKGGPRTYISLAALTVSSAMATTSMCLYW